MIHQKEGVKWVLGAFERHIEAGSSLFLAYLDLRSPKKRPRA